MAKHTHLHVFENQKKKKKSDMVYSKIVAMVSHMTSMTCCHGNNKGKRSKKLTLGCQLE